MKKIRKKMAKKFTALCMAATLTWTSMDVSVFASDSQGVTEVTQGRAQTITGTEGEIVGEFFVTGGMNGEEKAYTYDGNVLTIIKDTSISISNAENVEIKTDSIVVASDVTADIILNNVWIESEATSPISISSGAKANITLVGTNVLKGGIGDSNTYAGIYVPQGAGLVIGGTGSLTATGGGMVKINGSYPHNYRAAGIGGNGEQRDIHAGSIVINGGTIIATGGTAVNNKADGIGGGHYTLNGMDSKDYRGSCELTINGGLVKADSVTSDHLSKMVITIYKAKDGTIIDGGSGFPEGYCFDGVKTIGDKLYFYLPTGIVPEALSCEEITYTGSVSEGTGIFFNMKEVKENPEIDLSTGSVTFSKVGDVLTYTMGNETVLYSGAATIVDGDGTGNVIEVEKGVHGIVLNNVSIKPESASPISILPEAEAKITLVGDNVLVGGNRGVYAGIYVSLDGRLIIDGTGSLTAIGGSYRQSDDDSESYGSAAGIGGNGGSWNVHAGHILIMGGSVAAIGGSNGRCKASAIGGGHYIYSYYGSDDTSDNTSEYKGEAVVTIERGSVQADSIGAAPKNLNEEELYLLTIANPEKLEVTIDGNEYNPSVHSTDDTNLYAYVTGREHTVSVGGKETKYDFVDGKFYILLSEEMFTYVEPDSLIYDGAGKTASVMVNRDVEVGEITVKYYDEDGILTQLPTTVGTYTVKIDVTESSDCSAVTDLTSDEWKFTIKQATPVVENVVAKLDSETEQTIYATTSVNELVLEGTVTNAAGTPIEGSFRFADTVTELEAGTNSYAYIFTPDDANYEAVEGTISITAVKKELNIKVTATQRSYESGNDKVSIQVEVEGIKDSDDVSIENANQLEGTLSSADVGTYETVTLPSLILTGKDAGKYELSQNSGEITLTTPVTIEKAKATLTVNTTEYEKTFGNTDFTLDVTEDNSEIEAVYTITEGTDVVTVEDGTVTIKKAGTVIIKISLAETKNYHAAEDVMVTITVKKAKVPVNKPDAVIEVTNSCDKISSVALPDNWEWSQEDKDAELEVDTPFTATAKYIGEDAENYETTEVEITITRSSCEHEEGDVVCDNTIETDQAPTCTQSGTGHTICIKEECGKVLRTEVEIPELGHKYKSEITKPATTKESGIRTYTCEREGCNDSYEETIPKKSSSSSSSSSSTPTTQAPTTEEPTTEEPTTEEPTTEEPTTEEPTTEEPSTQKPSTEKPDTGESATVEWKSDEKGVYYEKEDGTRADGWLKLNDEWYFFDKEGYRETDWVKDNGTWYYLNENGGMETGWVKDEGNWYYLDKSGAMQTNWVKDGNTWYYLNTDGSMKTGWLKDGDSWYYLNTNGSMKTGWLKDKEIWYYLNTNGSMKTGWIQLGADWFYLNDSGAMAADTYIGIWYVDENGYYIPSKDKKN